MQRDNQETQFLKQRLIRIEQTLERRNEYDSDDQGRVLYRSLPMTNREYYQIREKALLMKLQNQVQEGKVLVAVTEWRGLLGEMLALHHAYYLKMQEALEDWERLPSS